MSIEFLISLTCLISLICRQVTVWAQQVVDLMSVFPLSSPSTCRLSQDVFSFRQVDIPISSSSMRMLLKEDHAKCGFANLFGKITSP